jgi:hypothetical protein
VQAPKELTLSVLRRKRDFSRGFSTRVPNTPTIGAERTAADLKGYAPCRRPPLSGCGLWGVGCAVLAGLGWAGLGWAGDAGKDELGRLARSGWLGLPLYFLLFVWLLFLCFFF